MTVQNNIKCLPLQPVDIKKPKYSSFPFGHNILKFINFESIK